MRLQTFKLTLVHLIISILYAIANVAGQDCDRVASDMHSQVQNIIAGTDTSNAIYNSYVSTANSQWATMSWTGQIDFSGIAFDDNRTCTLISPRHVVMATHYQRPINSTLVFHDSTGGVRTATLIAKQSIPGGINPDITVGLLDGDVPVKFYKVLPPQNNWSNCLNDVLAVSTHHDRNASIRKVDRTLGLFIKFLQSSSVPSSYYAPVVIGNSGNPIFLLINGEPILISTFSFEGSGIGPFYSEQSNFDAINSIMSSLGGGYQLETVYYCPSGFTFSGGGGLISSVSDTSYYAADGLIQTQQSISVHGDVTYDSSAEICLLPGFEVFLGGQLRTYHQGCTN